MIWFVGEVGRKGDEPGKESNKELVCNPYVGMKGQVWPPLNATEPYLVLPTCNKQLAELFKYGSAYTGLTLL